MRGDFDSAIERIALILGMSAKDRLAVLNEVVRRLVADDPVVDIKKPGRISQLATRRSDVNERAIFRVDQDRLIPRGTTYTCRGKQVTATKDSVKRMHGYNVQFIHHGQPYRKHFSDTKHGGPFGAKAAARKWRDETERSIGRNVITALVNIELRRVS
jgi:hypothetical protein